MTSSTEHCQRRIDPDVTVADDGKLPLPGRPNSFQRWLMKHLLQRLLRDSQHCSRTYREAFDNAVRAVRFVTAPLDSASGTCTPKFELRGPTSSDKEIGAKAPYPHAAGVPVLIDAVGTRYSGNV